MITSIKNELFSGYTKFEWVFFPSLLLMQLVVFYLNPDNLIGMVAGVSGIICVVMAAKSRISTYFWGVIQCAAYLYISWQAFFLGEVLLNVFYLAAQFIGFYAWRNNLVQSEESEKVEEVIAKKLTVPQWLMNIVGMVVAWYLFGSLLEVFGSNNPFVDSITTTLSVFAQIHMVKRLSSQWLLWICVNVFTILLWSTTSDWSMIALWSGMLMNSIYGYVLWTRSANKTVVA